MDTTTDTSDSPVFGTMIGLLTGRGVDSQALQNLQKKTTASARHSLWDGPDADDGDALADTDQAAASRPRGALRH